MTVLFPLSWPLSQVWDSTAQDPRLLVYLKAYRNTVPVPRHWSQKRKFLQVMQYCMSQSTKAHLTPEPRE